MAKKPKTLRVVHETPININGVLREPGDVFENPKTPDILPLLTNGYVEKVD